MRRPADRSTTVGASDALGSQDRIRLSHASDSSLGRQDPGVRSLNLLTRAGCAGINRRPSGQLLRSITWDASRPSYTETGMSWKYFVHSNQIIRH